MLLCDHAVVADGKLFINGGGWTLTGPAAVASGIAVLLEVPWDQANRRIPLALRLFTEDGQPVRQPGPVGDEQPIAVEVDFEVGRPPGLAPGSMLAVPLAVNIPPLPLPLGQRFYWELTVNGETREDWRVSFATRPPALTPRGGFGPTSLPPT